MNPLYGDMTIKEVRKEFARLLTPKLREHMAKKDLKQKEKKTADTSFKGDKNK